MTPGEVEKRVQTIREKAGDDEAAHSAEDALRRDVLLAIAGGARNARALARTALETEEIDFARWCA